MKAHLGSRVFSGTMRDTNLLLWCLCFITGVWLLVGVLVPSVCAQTENGCDGVEFVGRPGEQYSLDDLRKRMKRDPADVEALIKLGLYLEEQDQFAQALALYERVIEAKPDCYLGYQFAGLVIEKNSWKAFLDREKKLLKALELDPTLKKDPNLRGFLKRRSELANPPPKAAEPPPEPKYVLTARDRFLIGIVVGLLLTTPFLFLIRRSQRDASN